MTSMLAVRIEDRWLIRDGTGRDRDQQAYYVRASIAGSGCDVGSSSIAGRRDRDRDSLRVESNT